MSPRSNTINLSELTRYFAETQSILTQWLGESTKESMNKELHFGAEVMAVGKLLNFYFWHETYHLGQLEMLRRLAGKLEKIYK